MVLHGEFALSVPIRGDLRVGQLLQLVDDAGVQQGGGVPEVGRVILRDLAQDAAHDLAAPGLWKGVVNKIWSGDAPDLVGHRLLELHFRGANLFDALLGVESPTLQFAVLGCTTSACPTSALPMRWPE